MLFVTRGVCVCLFIQRKDKQNSLVNFVVFMTYIPITIMLFATQGDIFFSPPVDTPNFAHIFTIYGLL